MFGFVHAYRYKSSLTGVKPWEEIGPRFPLRLQGIKKSYGSRTVLKGVDLYVRRGEIISLVADQSTERDSIVKLLAGIESPDDGQIEVDGRKAQFGSRGQAEDYGVAYVPNDPELPQSLSVAAFICRRERDIFSHLNWITRSSATRAKPYLALVGFSELGPQRPLSALSVAELRLVSLARCLFLGASVLILDEPTKGASSADAKKIFDAIKAVADDGRSVVFVTDKAEEASAIVHRTAVLKNGRITLPPLVTREGRDLSEPIGKKAS